MVARVGKAWYGIVEMPLDDPIPLHPVPRPGKPANHIQNLAQAIQRDGYQLSQAVPVVRMPDGRLVLVGGHHRVAAMRLLAELTIPARVVDWDTLKQAVQDHYRNTYPGVF